jgi:hypothetical protein
VLLTLLKLHPHLHSNKSLPLGQQSVPTIIAAGECLLHLETISSVAKISQYILHLETPPSTETITVVPKAVNSVMGSVKSLQTYAAAIFNN